MLHFCLLRRMDDKQNKGYAFINMRSKDEVFEIFKNLDGRKWRMHAAKKRCKVSTLSPRRHMPKLSALRCAATVPDPHCRRPLCATVWQATRAYRRVLQNTALCSAARPRTLATGDVARARRTYNAAACDEARKHGRTRHCRIPWWSSMVVAQYTSREPPCQMCKTRRHSRRFVQQPQKAAGSRHSAANLYTHGIAIPIYSFFSFFTCNYIPGAVMLATYRTTCGCMCSMRTCTLCHQSRG